MSKTLKKEARYPLKLPDLKRNFQNVLHKFPTYLFGKIYSPANSFRMRVKARKLPEMLRISAYCFAIRLDTGNFKGFI